MSTADAQHVGPNLPNPLLIRAVPHRVVVVAETA